MQAIVRALDARPAFHASPYRTAERAPCRSIGRRAFVWGLGTVLLCMAGGLARGAGVATATDEAAAADAPAAPEPEVGRPAPDFSATDSKGEARRLADFRGKTLVLEWTNADCPYTAKHYSSGNMQSLQRLARRHDVVWLSVVSSAPGKQGYMDGAAADELSRSRNALPTAVLLDPSGALGRLYHAKTTPHMFIIDAHGDLRYMGGIDSIATADVADIAKAEPYFKEALLAVVEQRPVTRPVTRPYGCSIKY